MSDAKLGALLHLGANMWRRPDCEFESSDSNYATKLVCEKAEWISLTNTMADMGYKFLLIDMAEGVRYDSHPELAIEGSWSKTEFKEELSRLRSIGITPYPKFNFSLGHSAWLKEYALMPTTDIYYKVCKDLISEVCEIFDTPEFFHLGLEEEEYGSQLNNPVIVFRNAAQKIKDANFLFDVCRSCGTRPWIWVDPTTIETFGGSERFCKSVPKDVLISNWFYGKSYMGDGCPVPISPRMTLYKDIADWGYEQVPTTSNWGSTLNAKDTLNYCKQNCGDSIIGYMCASWLTTTDDNHYGNVDCLANMYYAKKDIYKK